MVFGVIEHGVCVVVAFARYTEGRIDHSDGHPGKQQLARQKTGLASNFHNSLLGTEHWQSPMADHPVHHPPRLCLLLLAPTLSLGSCDPSFPLRGGSSLEERHFLGVAHAHQQPHGTLVSMQHLLQHPSIESLWISPICSTVEWMFLRTFWTLDNGGVRVGGVHHLEVPLDIPPKG